MKIKASANYITFDLFRTNPGDAFVYLKELINFSESSFKIVMIFNEEKERLEFTFFFKV